ncbi:MAG: hypothetical protein EHM50_02415 [Lysobacterales bacterium]|nr:MAG: hypothetical protein EHM50_02415 [Xanthomonadales bacterium]
MITTWRGQNDFVSRASLRDRWPFPTLSLHGAENGLSHPSTVDRMWLIFKDAGRRYLPPQLIPDAGHQDALVGSKRDETCEAIKDFLTSTAVPPEGPVSEAMVAYPPWIGPIITEERPSPTGVPRLVIRLGAAPTHHKPEGVVMLSVSLDGDRIVRPDDPTLPWDLDYVLSHAAYYKSGALKDTRWDAFEAPLPELMPGYPPAGEALLLLIVYSESPFLAPGREYAYYRMSFSTPGFPVVEEFLPTSRDHFERTTIPPDNFVRAARASLSALVAQQPPELRPMWMREVRPMPARERPGHPVLLAAPGLRNLELPVAVIPNLPDPPVVTGLLFGTNTTQETLESIDTPTGTAVLDALDSDLTEGVVPYYSPPSPPTTPNPSGTRFALLSCQYPAGFLDEPIAYESYRRVLARLEAAAGDRPRFVVLTGDQVYVDPTAGLYDPSAQDARYRVPYEYWLRQRNVRHTLRCVPSFMLLDDHEIDDNWAPLPPSSGEHNENQARYTGGTDAYRKYQRGKSGNLGFDFRYDGFPFYLLDTRTTRTHRTVATMSTAALIDDSLPSKPFTAFTNWLQSAGAGPKFVVSPAQLLPRHRRTAQHGGGLDAKILGALHSDGWDGYPRTFAAVLGLIAEKGIQHVVFLSGDEHRGCVTVIELRDKTNNLLARVHSIHTTAAYAPFPFANSLADDFMKQETISFTHNGTSYTCVVDATLPPARDGATLLRPWRDGSAWKLDYEFTGGIGGGTLTL